MTTIAIGSRLCHRARLHMPWVGRWVLRAWFDGAPPSGKVTVQWGSTALVGTVLPEKSGQTVGEGVATIVGGVGWDSVPPAAWLVNTAAAPAQVAQQLSQAIGETLLLDATALRPGRVAYARAAQPASDILYDLLAPAALWWVELGGATRAAGARTSPVLAPELVLDVDLEARTARLDILEPSQAPVGGVFPAQSERFPDLRIYALDIEASEEGVLTTARLEPPADTLPHLAALLEAATHGAPPTPHATWRTATVQSADAMKRVSLRLEERDRELADPLPVRAFCGVPGVSAEVFAGTRVLLAFDRADPTNPLAGLWSPFGETGHVPRNVAHEAAEHIDIVTTSGGDVRIGPPGVGEVERLPLAKAPHVQAYLEASEAWANQVDSLLFTLATLAGVPIPPTYTTAISDRLDASLKLPLIPTTRSESA
jgi:hypothetical protein